MIHGLQSSSVSRLSNLFWAGVAVFVLNDIAKLYLADQPLNFYLFDYGYRLALLIVLLIVFRRRNVPFRHLFVDAKRAPIGSVVRWTIVACVVGVAINQSVGIYLGYRIESPFNLRFPPVPDSLRIFDLTAGLMLVSLSEELWFRRLALWVLPRVSRRKRKPRHRNGDDPLPYDRFSRNRLEFYSLVALTSLLFGAIHWSFGYHHIISTALWAIVPMLSLIRTRSLWPALISHFTTNLVAFSGVIPVSYYELFTP